MSFKEIVLVTLVFIISIQTIWLKDIYTEIETIRKIYEMSSARELNKR